MQCENIDIAICRTQLGRELSTCEGDCGSIAVALQKLFGGEIVGVTKEPESDIPIHIAVRIDGVVYDGDGRTTLESLATIGMFVPERTRSEQLSQHFWSAESVPPYMVDEQKVEIAKDKIETAINEKND